MMKKIIFAAFVFLPFFAMGQNSTFILNARLAKMPVPTKLYITYPLADRFAIDSAMVTGDSVVTFQGIIPYPLKAQLWLDHKHVGLSKLKQDADMYMCYLDGGTINLNAKDSIRYAVITGSRINKEYIKYKAFIAGPVQELASLQLKEASATDIEKKDPVFIADIKAKYHSATEKKTALQKRYIQQNSDSEFSLGALHEISVSGVDMPEIEPMFDNLSTRIRNTIAGKQFAMDITSTHSTSIGNIAPTFTLTDINGQKVNLTDFRGKYILLDFWASWCAPCRAENPNVVKAYQKYHDKNFSVLGVSLDRPGKKDAWVAAIKADGLNWTQVSDLKFWDSEVVKLYGIKGIPENYLIDPTGKIIAKSLHGDELDRKLNEILSR